MKGRFQKHQQPPFFSKMRTFFSAPAARHRPRAGRYHFGTIMVKSYKSCSYERQGVYSLARVLTYSFNSLTH